jgi:hypothetical protein
VIPHYLSMVTANFTQAKIDTLARLMGPCADGRRRPRRIQRKLDKRGGYRRHDSLGALLWSIDHGG